jgi:RNA polymerase sigma-70 factor (ECF subfamily)
MNEDDERALIARFQDGDDTAYGALFDANQRPVLNLALRMLRAEEAALDVAQEVFMRAYEELRKWRGEARFSTWLYRTALNVCYERIRAEEKQRRLKANAVPGENMPAPEVGISGLETKAVIERAVRGLPARQRVIFILKQYEELRFSEIAERLKITEGGAKASYHKALLALRDRLKEFAPERVRSVVVEDEE